MRGRVGGILLYFSRHLFGHCSLSGLGAFYIISVRCVQGDTEDAGAGCWGEGGECLNLMFSVFSRRPGMIIGSCGMWEYWGWGYDLAGTDTGVWDNFFGILGGVWWEIFNGGGARLVDWHANGNLVSL